MRVKPAIRIAVLAVVALLAAATLTACRTNVGYAATIEGKRYSEDDISGYLTPAAEPVRSQSQDGSQTETPVRAFVMETLIVDKLLAKIARQLPGGGPNAAAVARLRATVLQGRSAKAAITAAGIRGFASSLNPLLVRQAVYSQYLQAAQQQGVDVQRLATSVPFAVSVNPRYGTWNAKTKTFDGAPGRGAPGFVMFKSPLTSADRSGSTATTSP